MTRSKDRISGVLGVGWKVAKSLRRVNLVGGVLDVVLCRICASQIHFRLEGCCSGVHLHGVAPEDF